MEKGGGNSTCLSPRSKEACHNIGIALLESIAMMRTPSNMRSNKKTLHEFTPHITPKSPKGNKSRWTNEIMHADISIRTQ
jgi:hypothetical protein